MAIDPRKPKGVSWGSASGQSNRNPWRRDCSAGSTDTAPTTAVGRVPCQPCIWHRIGGGPSPASQSALRSCTRTTSKPGLASSRSLQKPEIDRALQSFQGQAGFHICVVPSRRRFKIHREGRQKLNRTGNAWIGFMSLPSAGAGACNVSTVKR
jgi:hypothetical protein